MDVQDIEPLDDAAFRELVTDHLHSRKGDPQVWGLLTGPRLVQRTCGTLAAIHRQVTGTMLTKKTAREEFRQECFARGEAGKRDWFASLAEYESWRRRAGHFALMVQERLSDAKKALKAANRAANDTAGHTHRMVLRQLAIAVQDHQAAHARAGGVAEQCDYELWRLLDKLTVPIGPRSEQMTLRTMLDIYWRDVEPVDEAREETAHMDDVMRAAPAGRSARYEGVPSARYVGNDKKLV